MAASFASGRSRPVGADQAAGDSVGADQATSAGLGDSWSLQLEAGSEYDSNIHRLELDPGDEGSVDAVGAPVARLAARHRLTWRRAPRQRLVLSSYGGLKAFGSDSGQSENVAILSVDGGYEWAVAGRGAIVGVQASYYDAIPFELYQPKEDLEDLYGGRTFRTGAGQGIVTLAGDGGHRVSALAGYRAFHYKPDPVFDWQGEQVAMMYQATVWSGDPDADADAASIDLASGYRVERRNYEGTALTSSCPDYDPDDPLCRGGRTTLPRRDLNHALAAEVIYTGQRIYSARYELQVNDSNSFGESLIRQRLRLGFTTELFGGLYLTAEGTVLVNIYLDPLLVARDEQARTFISIDEENRNSLSAHLSRPLAGRWAIEGRYAIYSNELSNQELTFRRQTVYLGAVYRYGR